MSPSIYIINLKQTPERKLQIQRQLDAFNLDYQVIEAIDKYDLYSREHRATVAHELNVDENKVELMYKTKSASEVACVLSHVKIFNLIIENNIPRACVLEDDVHLLPEFPKMLIASQEVSWDVLMLSHQSRMTLGILRSFHSDSLTRKFFHHLPRLILYKISYLELNLYTARSILLSIVKDTLWSFLNMFKRSSAKYRNNMQQVHKFMHHLYRKEGEHKIKERYWESLACELRL